MHTTAPSRTLTALFAFSCAALLAAPAAAQERLLDQAAARERAAAFLLEGDLAPRPDLRPAEVRGLEASEADDPLHGPCWRFVGRRDDGALRFELKVERRAGRVIALTQLDREMVVRRWNGDGSARTGEDMHDEAEGRSRYRPDELRARAWAWLRRMVPDHAERRFQLETEQLVEDGIVFRRFHFVERPRPGVLACFRNDLRLWLSPETGEPISILLTDLRHEVTEPPPVSGAEATRLAAREANGDPAAAAPPRLEVLRVEGELTPVWIVRLDEDVVALVHARDPQVLAVHRRD